jgi:hypothetical protein
MFVWVNPGEAESVPEDVFTLVEGMDDQLERWGPGGTAGSVPANPADLMAKLGEVEQPAAANALGWLLSTTMAYGGPGRYDGRKARDVVNTLVGLLGHGTRWWVNTEAVGPTGARGWSPVTRCTFDAIVVGAGGGVLVTILAVDED